MQRGPANSFWSGSEDYDGYQRGSLPIPSRESPPFNDYPHGGQGRGRQRPRHHTHPNVNSSGDPMTVDVRLYGFGPNEAPDIHNPGSFQWPGQPGPGGTSAEPQHMLCITAARRWFNNSKQHRLDMTCSPSLLKIEKDSEYPIKWLYVLRTQNIVQTDADVGMYRVKLRALMISRHVAIYLPDSRMR